MNLKRFFAIVFAILVALSLGSTRLAAQTATTGDVAGVVTDPSNAVVPDAKVNLKDNAKGNSQDTRTNKDGGFRFYLLSPGSYTLSVTASGFQVTSRQVQVAVSQIATADLQLSLGASTQTVTVTEAVPLIQTENGDTSSALSQQQVSNVPNPGNDLSAIAQLAPGVIVNSQGGFGNVEAFGMPATSNLFTMNGMDDNDPFLNLNNSGATNLLLGSNEVQEADVVTNGYSSAYGTFAGIDVNYITKSGGNEFHGNAIYFWNGRAMNANDWFNKANGQPRAFDNANQWAASIGGPIKKDKLFFFLNTEGLRVLIPVPTNIFVPTVPFETALVQNLVNQGLQNSIPFYCQNLAGICPGVGPLPGSGQGMFNFFNAVKNQATAQNNLPNGGCSDVPAATGFGAANPCAVNIRETPVNFAPEKQIAGRADWNIGQNDRAYLRMQYDQGIQPTFTDPISPVFNTQSNQPEYQGQLNETHTFGPTLTNQFLLAATWYSAIFKSANEPATLAAFPTNLFFLDQSITNTATGLGFGGEDFAFPQGRNVTQIQFGDDVSKTIGNHTVKFGAKYHGNWVSDHDFGNRIIGLEFVPSLDGFFNGQGAFLQQNFTNAVNEPIRLHEVAGYVQDDWRVRSNLTISPAIRLEHASNPQCLTHCFAQLSEPLTTVGANPGPYNQIIQAGRKDALLNYQGLQWEPRISFAWQPFGSASGFFRKDLVVRGGAGIFYDIFPGAIADNMAQNAPLFNPFTVFAGTAGCPQGFLSPNQAGNLFDCASAANTAFVNAFNSGASVLTQVPSITITDRHTKAPQFQKWSLEIQKGLGPNDSIDIGYYGNHGIHIPVFFNSINACGGGANCGGPAFDGLPANPITAQFGEVTDITSAGVSNYNGIVASYKHRFSGWAGSGVFQFNYTYGRAMDEFSNGGFFGFTGQSVLNPENPLNFNSNYGPADYDARHSLNANYVWEVPVRKALRGHGWAPLVDGWQVSGSAFYRTGFPVTVIDGAEAGALNANNVFGPLFPNILNPAVNRTCNSEKFAGPAAVSCFGANTNFGDGAGGVGSETGFGGRGLRGAFRGPSYFDTDFSFTKKTKIPRWERGELAVGLQMFNALNHPNFTLPINDISSGAFGNILSGVNPPTSILGSFLGGDAAPRLIQVKASLTF